MSKFKFGLGDKVRIFKTGKDIVNILGGWVPNMDKLIGSVCFIKERTQYASGEVGYRLEGIGYIWDERVLELAETQAKWNRFTTRPLTEEEREEYPEGIDFMWNVPIPDIDETVLVSNGESAWTDTWIVYGFASMGLEDTEAEGLWWMPLPELPKEVE